MSNTIMQRFIGSGLGRNFSEDVIDAEEPAIIDEPTADANVVTSEPDYAFEGYSVEFIDKVALMPMAPVGLGYANG